MNDYNSPMDLDTFDKDKELKLFDDYTPNPVQILVRLYIESDNVGGVYRDIDDAIYNSMSGYVASIGKHCFTGEHLKDWGAWYKVGDYIAFPRHAGSRFEFKGLPVFSIIDSSVIGKIKCPTDVTK